MNITEALKSEIAECAYAMATRRFPDVQDFSGHCLILAGSAIACAHKRGVRLVLQAGSAYWPRVTQETDDGTEANRFGYEWEPHTPHSQRMLALGAMPEIHVWCAHVETQSIVDLTSGMFPAQAMRLLRSPWKAPNPPRWFWGTGKELPDGASYSPTLDATRFAAMKLCEALETMPTRERGRA